VADSFRLRNRQLLVAAKRWLQPFWDTANIKLTARNERQNNFRQSRLAIPSQNQKRCNATQKPTHSCTTFAFAPTAQQTINYSFK